MSNSICPWIGVDLDGTLAYYDKWVQWDSIGKVIEPMKARILKWLESGRDVRIFTARVAYVEDTCYVTGQKFSRADMVAVVQKWLIENGLPALEITHEKNHQMIELWDDRAVQVVPNTGRTLAEEYAAERSALSQKAYGDRG